MYLPAPARTTRSLDNCHTSQPPTPNVQGRPVTVDNPSSCEIPSNPIAMIAACFTAFLVAAMLARRACRCACRARAAARSRTTRPPVAHALNRLTFGARPGDVERVQQIGLAAWIDQQLHPVDASTTAPPKRMLPQLAAIRRTPPTQGAARREAPGRQTLAVRQDAARDRTASASSKEVLVDFWFNHFNVFAGKGRTAIYLPEYERDAIRPHVLRSFPRSARGHGEEPGDALLSG